MKLYTEIEYMISEVNAGRLDLTQLIKEYEETIDALKESLEQLRSNTDGFISPKEVEKLEEAKNTFQSLLTGAETKVEELSKEVSSLKEKIVLRDRNIADLRIQLSANSSGILI